MRVQWLPLVAAPVAQFAFAAQYMTVEQAQRAAFPDATRFDASAATPAQLAAAGAPAGWTPKLWTVRSDARALGWFALDQVIGKSELITYSVALAPDGAVLAIEVLDYREAHGGEIRLPGWRHQFVGKTAADPVELDRDIRNISGATLSCRHVTEGVHRLLKLHAAMTAGAR